MQVFFLFFSCVLLVVVSQARDQQENPAERSAEAHTNELAIEQHGRRDGHCSVNEPQEAKVSSMHSSS